jgi:hypothetical protein
MDDAHQANEPGSQCLDAPTLGPRRPNERTYT